MSVRWWLFPAFAAAVSVGVTAFLRHYTPDLLAGPAGAALIGLLVAVVLTLAYWCGAEPRR